MAKSVPFRSSLCKMTPNTEIMPNVSMLMSAFSMNMILGMKESSTGIGISVRKPSAVEGIEVMNDISSINASGFSA